jgi:hypothetical protein
MSDKPKMNREIPSFPILLKRSTVPPIHIKLSITKFQQLCNYIEENMKHTIKSSYPHNSIWNC